MAYKRRRQRSGPGWTRNAVRAGVGLFNAYSKFKKGGGAKLRLKAKSKWRVKTRQRLKTSGSRSNTRRKVGAAKWSGGGFSMSGGTSRFTRIFRGYPLGKKLRRALLPQTLTAVTTGKLTSTQGAQGVGFLKPADFNGTTLNPLVTNTDINVMWEQLRLNSYGTPAGGPTADNSEKMEFKGVTARFVFKNMTNVASSVILYECFPRHDQISATITPVSAWTDGLADENVGFTITGDVAATPNLPGSTPFMSKEFVRWFRVAKVTKFTLQPGAEHVHITKLIYNKILDKLLTSTYSYMRNMTWFGVYAVRGGIVQDTTTPFATSIAPTEIDVVADTKWEFKQLTRIPESTVCYNTLATNLATPAVIVEETGGEAQYDAV